MRNLATWLAILFLGIQPSRADTGKRSIFYGFRWGGETDDKVLLDGSEKVSDESFRLTKENILSAVQFDASKGWKKSSGSGVYFSEDPVDSFGDNRHELFIVELTSPEGKSFPIAQGNLGDTVRAYYLSNGPQPPIVSKYSSTWYVIARLPSGTGNEEGLDIQFHPATENDAPKILEALKSKWAADSATNLSRVLDKISYRVNDPAYPVSPPKTLKFLEAFVEHSAEIFPNAYSDPNKPQDAQKLSQQRASLLSTLAEKIKAPCVVNTIKSTLEK